MGAVLNESLNSACAVVANRKIGSVPYLIENGVNGYTYSQRKRNDLFIKVKKLLDCNELRYSMQQNAYETMLNTWNADSASERLIKLIECLKKEGIHFILRAHAVGVRREMSIQIQRELSVALSHAGKTDD